MITMGGGRLDFALIKSTMQVLALMDQAMNAHNVQALIPLKILLADDDVVFRTAIQAVLRLMGHDVVCAKNGRVALELAAELEPDVVFLDIQMPEMGGLEVARSLRRLRQDDRFPRIIGLSGDCEEWDTCSAAGMDDFLAKPVRPTDLSRVLITSPRS